MKYLLVFLVLTGCIVKKDETHIHPCVVVPPKASKIELTLINGDEANPKDWPTIFKAVQGSASCTGTVIGPKVLQLAAHCVGDGKTSIIEVSGAKMSAKCTRHPSYKDDATADYALCLFDKEIDLPWYETITDQEVKLGDDLLLTGMGCTQPGGGVADWKLRIGLAEVVELPTDDNDIVTKGPAACFGDSGSSAFMKIDDHYKVVAITSRSDLVEYSYLPSVYTNDAKSFYSKWISDNKADICGITKDMKKCRGIDPIVPPGPGPTPPGPQPECPKS